MCMHCGIFQSLQNLNHESICALHSSNKHDLIQVTRLINSPEVYISCLPAQPSLQLIGYPKQQLGRVTLKAELYPCCVRTWATPATLLWSSRGPTALCRLHGPTQEDPWASPLGTATHPLKFPDETDLQPSSGNHDPGLQAKVQISRFGVHQNPWGTRKMQNKHTQVSAGQELCPGSHTSAALTEGTEAPGLPQQCGWPCSVLQAQGPCLAGSGVGGNSSLFR